MKLRHVKLLRCFFIIFWYQPIIFQNFWLGYELPIGMNLAEYQNPLEITIDLNPMQIHGEFQ